MKKLILFLVLVIYQNGFSQLVLNHSDYSKPTGKACVIYNEILYNIKWLPQKKWEIKAVEECGMGGQKAEFQKSEKDSINFENEIILMLKKRNTRNYNAPKHP